MIIRNNSNNNKYKNSNIRRETQRIDNCNNVMGSEYIWQYTIDTDYE